MNDNLDNMNTEKFQRFVNKSRESLLKIYNDAKELMEDAEMSFDEFCQEVWIELSDDLRSKI